MAEAIARVRRFVGIHNFRDYGDYSATGGRLRPGVLFRSGQHVDATPDDLVGIAALDLQTVIDLRGRSERSRYPCARPDGFAAQVLFFNGETSGRGGAPHVAAAREVASEADARAAMIDLYAFMPFRPNLIAILTDYFATLADGRGPHLVHCLAGKDRTGLAVALLHDLLGVHPDDAMADYLLTNSAGDPEPRIAAGAASIRASKGPSISDGAVRVLMGVEPAFLYTAIAEVRREHGSTDAYLRDRLGVTEARRASIIERFIA